MQTSTSRGHSIAVALSWSLALSVLCQACGSSPAEEPKTGAIESEDGSEVQSSVQRPASLELLSERDVTPTGMTAYRPDVVAVGGELWLAYNTGERGMQLQRFDLELTPIGQAVDLQAAAEMPTDIRVGLSDGRFWYAYETATLGAADCLHNFLSVALYAKAVPPQLDRSAEHIATGCPTSIAFIQNPSGLPEHPEAVDDPSPFVHQGARYVLTRAWPEASPVHHLRKLDDQLNVAEESLLDSEPLLPGRKMSQNALLHIDGEPFLVAGFSNGPPNGSSTSDLFAARLSDDLSAFEGAAVRLDVTDASFPHRVTRARHVNGTLIINYVDQASPTRERLALFDARASFAVLSQIEVQDHQVADNHSSFEVVDDRLYLFQQQTGEKLSAKVFRLKQ